jgi:hypothetical protein
LIAPNKQLSFAIGKSTTANFAYYWLRVSSSAGPGDRELSVEDGGSPYQCDEFVAISAESQHFIILKACEIIVLPAPSRSTLREGAALAEVA